MTVAEDSRRECGRRAHGVAPGREGWEAVSPSARALLLDPHRALVLLVSPSPEEPRGS